MPGIYKVAVLISAAVLAVACSSDSHATVVAWTFENVKFADGAIATGFFQYNTSTINQSKFDIKIAGGSLPAIEYNSSNSAAYGFRDCLFTHGGECFGDHQTMRFARVGTNRSLELNTLPFSGTNQTLGLIPDPSTIYGPGASTELAWRFIVAGSVAPVPAGNMQLVNVIFDDGGTATGSFQFHPDANGGQIGAFDINTTKGDSLPGFRYTSAGANAFVTGFGPEFFDFAQQRGFAMEFSPPLSNTGAPVVLDFHCIGCASEDMSRGIVSGTIIGAVIPEPSVGLLLTDGALLLAGVFGWRKHRFVALICHGKANSTRC